MQPAASSALDLRPLVLLAVALVPALHRPETPVVAPSVRISVTEPIVAEHPPVKYPDYCRQDQVDAKGSHTVEEHRFDSMGRLVSDLTFYDDFLAWTRTRDYDDAGRLAHETTEYRGGSEFTLHDSYRYDARGREIEVREHRTRPPRDGIPADDPEELTIHTYDRDGRLETTRWGVDARTRRGGNLSRRHYAGDHLVLEEAWDEDDGAHTRTWTSHYRYDPRGMLGEVETTWRTLTIANSLIRYRYDTAGRELERITVEGGCYGERDGTAHNVYDAAGNLLSYERRSPAGDLIERVTNSYDCWR